MMGHYADFRVVDSLGEFSYYSIGEVSVSNKGSVCLFFRIWQLGPLGLRMGRVGSCSMDSGASYDPRIGQVARSYLIKGCDLKNGLRNYYFLGSRVQ